MVIDSSSSSLETQEVTINVLKTEGQTYILKQQGEGGGKWCFILSTIYWRGHAFYFAPPKNMDYGLGNLSSWLDYRFTVWSRVHRSESVDKSFKSTLWHLSRLTLTDIVVDYVHCIISSQECLDSQYNQQLKQGTLL